MPSQSLYEVHQASSHIVFFDQQVPSVSHSQAAVKEGQGSAYLPRLDPAFPFRAYSSHSIKPQQKKYLNAATILL